MGRAGTSRDVLAFYSSGSAEAESTFRTMAAISARVRLFSDNQTKATKTFGRTEAHYGALRLAGESLIVAEASGANVEAVVKRMQNAGQPAVFVVQQGYANVPYPHLKAETPLPAGACPVKPPLIRQER